MGSGASRQVSQGTIRKFPNRPPGSTVSSPPPSKPAAAAASRRPLPGQRKTSEASSAKSDAIRKDGSDPDISSPNNMISPDFARRLGQIGVVEPNPTFSPSSTASPSFPTAPSLQQTSNSGPIFPSPSHNLVLSALAARERLEHEADEEFHNLGTSSSQGRRFLPPTMIRDVLVMRERGATDQQIQNRFNLKNGVLDSLGRQDQEPKTFCILAFDQSIAIPIMYSMCHDAGTSG